MRWHRYLQSFFMEDKEQFIVCTGNTMAIDTCWCRMEPGHQQLWYWSNSPRIFWPQRQKSHKILYMINYKLVHHIFPVLRIVYSSYLSILYCLFITSSQYFVLFIYYIFSVFCIVYLLHLLSIVYCLFITSSQYCLSSETVILCFTTDSGAAVWHDKSGECAGHSETYDPTPGTCRRHLHQGWPCSQGHGGRPQVSLVKHHHWGGYWFNSLVPGKIICFTNVYFSSAFIWLFDGSLQEKRNSIALHRSCTNPWYW